jgi:hypothetical protein
MTLIDERTYRDFCQQCGVGGFYYEEPYDAKHPAYALAEVADWMIQEPDHLRRFLARYTGDADDIQGIAALIADQTACFYPKYLLSVAVLRDWIAQHAE